MNILSKKVTVSYLFKLLLVSAGLVLWPSAVFAGTSTADVSAASDFTGTIAGSDLASKVKTYLYCNATSGDQKCSMAVYVPVSVDGSISPTLRSSVTLAITSIASNTTSALSESIALSTLGAGTQLLAWTGLSSASDWDFSLTNTMPGDGAGAMNNVNASSLASGDILVKPTNAGEVKQLTFDDKVCFNGNSAADYNYTTADVLTSHHPSAVSVTTTRAATDHVAFLLSKASAEFDRDTIGSAKNFTIIYSQTVLANSITTDAADCPSDG